MFQFRHFAFLILLFACLFLLACGSGGPSGTGAPNSHGFVNQTDGAVTDDRLLDMWGTAQTQVATQQFTLNAATLSLNGGVPQTAGPDARATSVQPNGVTVIAIADIPVASLPPQFKEKGYADPTGVIDRCTDAVHYCHSSLHGNTIYVARSLAGHDGATGWEFQNVILARLGYNISGR